MSTRRSARLSAASIIAEKLPETTSASPVAKTTRAIVGNGPTGSKVKLSRKRKAISPDISDSSLPPIASSPPKKEAISREESEPSLPPIKPALKKRKIASNELSDSPPTKNASPSTPKRKKTSPILPPPVTPTPAAIGSMSSPYKDVGDSMPPPPVPVDRLAVLNGTNAPLVTPETHRLLANKSMDEVSPSKPPAVKVSTSDVLNKAIEHLIKVEPKLKPIIEKHPCKMFSAEGLAEEIEPFRALVSGIISQQVGRILKTNNGFFVCALPDIN